MQVLESHIYLNDLMVQSMLHRFVGIGESDPMHSPLEALANRELEVLRLIGQGVETADIAERLHLSVKTIETYRDRIREKLNLE